ncbi:hypothetical protein ABH926_007572 [Catenulispora sp. GP43]|uniref:hypothetical protein n=1 Tax=Catenulispora sp. GP43 TaxID=3156263 RepID=UPI003511EE68
MPSRRTTPGEATPTATSCSADTPASARQRRAAYRAADSLVSWSSSGAVSAR